MENLQGKSDDSVSGTVAAELYQPKSQHGAMGGGGGGGAVFI